MDRIDINDAKPALEKTMNKIRALPESANKTTLLQYADWHQQKLNQNTMSLLSVKKSLDVAFQVTAFCKNINDLNQKEIEDWWAYQLERQANQTKRKGTKEVIQIQTERKLSQGSILKLSSQALKYIKFVSFLKRGKPTSFYNSKREKIPECAECLFVSPAPSLPEQKPTVSQKQIKRNTNEGLLFCKKEVWLSEIITNWVSLTDTGSVRTNLGECLFPWKVARVKSIITKYTKPLGITPHDLRHSRASYFGVLSGNPYLVKELLGHASLETSKAYVHLGQSEIKRLIGG